MAKPKYTKWLQKNNLLLIQGWARDGCSIEQIAKKMGVSAASLHAWMNNFVEILEAVNSGREVADYTVENSLYKRAVGYDTWEEEQVWDADKEEWIHVKRKLKHVPPDVSAQTLWLKNRKPNDWREHPEHEENVEYEDDGLIEALKECTVPIVPDVPFGTVIDDEGNI